MDASSESVSQSPINRPMMIAVVAIVFAMWLLGCLISTRCCRHMGQHNDDQFGSNNRGTVWALDSMAAMNSVNAQELRDFRLAQQLQNDEVVQAALTPEELEAARAERERKAKARRELIKKVLPDGELYTTSDTSADDEENQQCAICLADYEEGDTRVSGTADLCQHAFHRTCIAEWLLRQSACPVCRQVFLLEDMDIKEDMGSSDDDVADVDV